METKDTVSSCSVSQDQEIQQLHEKAQLSKEGCMKSLRAIQSQFKFLTDSLQDFGTMPIFKRTFAQDLDLLEQHLTKEIISQTDCKTILTKLRTTFENAFNSEFKERMQKYTRFDAQSFKDAMICNMDSIGKYMLEIILHQQRTPQLLKQKKLMQTQEDHSNPIPALNVDSLKVDLVVIQNTCSKKEDSNSETASSKSVKESSLDYATKDFTLDYDSQMTDKYFIEYTGIEVKHFKDTLFQHMGNVKKSVAERTRHQRHRSGNDTDADDADIIPIYNEEPMAEVQLTTECNIFATRQYHTEQPEIINDGRVDHNKAKIKKEIDVLETMNIELEHSVAKLLKENETLKKHYKDLYDSVKITRSKTIEQTTSLLANNADLKAQIQEKVFAIAALKNDLRKLKGNSVDTKFAKTSVLGKPVLQSLRKQSVVRQPNAFKSKRPQMSKPRFASQDDVNNNLSKIVTRHYLPKRRESDFEPDHMIASSKSRNSSKNMPRFRSNDVVHNHYLSEAKKKTQERDRNSKTSVIPSARLQSTTDDSKSKSRSNNQHLGVCLYLRVYVFNENHDACITKLLKEVNSRAKIQSHKTRNSNKPVDQKSHTQKPGRQIFTRHMFSPNKTFAVYEKTSPRSDLRWKLTGRIFKYVGLRWIPTGKLFASCTSNDDSEPTHGSNVDIPNIHKSKQTLNISASTSINVQKEQSFDLSAVDSKLISKTTFEHNSSSLEPQSHMTSEHNSSGLKPQCQRMMFEHDSSSLDPQCQMTSDHISSDPIPQCPTTALEQDSLSLGPQSQENVTQAAKTVTTLNELDLLFSLMFDELLNGTTPVVSKSFAVIATDAPNKRQQQHTTPSTSTIVAADTPSLNIQTTPKTTSQPPTQVPTVTTNENIIQAETNKEYAQVDEDEFINVFSTPVQEQGETSSRYVDSSNMHTFYQ
ncbi:hypothetical protein Tco_1447892 [Tanacetum coccineum]